MARPLHRRVAQDRGPLSPVVTEARRFPPPWTVEETDACFIVKDHTGHSLAYVYFEEEPGRRAAAKHHQGGQAPGAGARPLWVSFVAFFYLPPKIGSNRPAKCSCSQGRDRYAYDVQACAGDAYRGVA